MSNGEKKEFLEKVRFFVKMIFSQELLKNVAQDIAADPQNHILGSPASAQEHEQQQKEHGQLQES